MRHEDEYSLCFVGKMQFGLGLQNGCASMDEANIENDSSQCFGDVAIAIFHFDEWTLPEIGLIERFFE